MRRFLGIAKSITPIRFLNLMGVYVGYGLSILLRRPVVLSRPCFITVEPACGCNLACPECPVGTGELHRGKGAMTMETLRQIVDTIAKRAVWVNLYFQGEPLLNPNLTEMVALFSSRRIFTSMSTNGLLLTEAIADKLVNSGLKEIIFSIDGATEEEYLAYRRGGSLMGAWNAVAMMVAARKSRRTLYPRIAIQSLVTSANEHSLTVIRQQALAAGADAVEFKTLHLHRGIDREHLLPTNLQYSRYNSKGRKSLFNLPCFRLWSTAVISWNGTLALCCMDKEVEAVGYLSVDLLQGWKSSAFNSARQASLYGEGTPDICNYCSL
ncbi:MAG TPA: radical SAM protein [Williamwhitmania sp.]|nr:radical SAM protein [Williamwhitmania sp.]